jgi:hypothetical protein
MVIIDHPWLFGPHLAIMHLHLAIMVAALTPVVAMEVAVIVVAAVRVAPGKQSSWL